MSKVPGPAAATPGTPSSEDYRDLVENLNEGVYRSTPQGRILLANRALADILGYASVEELLHKDIARDFYVDPRDREENLRALAQHGAISHYSLRLRRKGGDAILVEETSRAVCDEQGATLYYEGIIEDVTARRHSEQQAQYFGDLFQATIENVSDGVIHLALDGIIRYVNSSIERNAGLGRDQMIGRHFCEVWPNSPALSDQGYGTWADAFQASVERGEPVLLNKFPILCRNDGTSSEKAFVLRLVPQLIEGRMHGVTVFVEFFTEQLQLRKRILQDIRRRKALERELLSA
ncbi:MAG: PAS domain S-box protein, partial [Acidobacteria bacterium]|nr:PAS domain S-box protein [Acidobacteriota bacterium]